MLLSLGPCSPPGGWGPGSMGVPGGALGPGQGLAGGSPGRTVEAAGLGDAPSEGTTE